MNIIMAICTFLFAERNARQSVITSGGSSTGASLLRKIWRNRVFRRTTLVVVTTLLLAAVASNFMSSRGGFIPLVRDATTSSIGLAAEATGIATPKTILTNPNKAMVTRAFVPKCTLSPGVVEFSNYQVGYDKSYDSNILPDWLTGTADVSYSLQVSGKVILASDCQDMAEHLSYDETTGLLTIELPRPTASMVEINYDSVKVTTEDQGAAGYIEGLVNAVRGNQNTDEANEMYAAITPDLKSQFDSDEELVASAQEQIADFYQQIADAVGHGLHVEVQFSGAV